MPLPIPPHIPPVSPAPTSTGSFVSDGLTLHYEVHGEAGPWILFHPGVGFPRTYFRPIAGILKRHARCVLLDPRGVRDSEGPVAEDEYALPYLAADVVRLAEHLDTNRVWLFGHSLGANVMAEVAIRHPEVCERLFLISFAAATEMVKPFVRWVRQNATPEQRAVLDAYESKGPVLDVDAGFPLDYGETSGLVWAPHVLHTRLTPSVLWNMGQYERPAAALWGRDSAIDVTGLMMQIDQRRALRALRCPVHLFVGRYDQYAMPSVPLARLQVPDLSVHELSESNHHGHVEEPARVADVMLEALGVLRADIVSLRSDVTLEPAEDDVDQLVLHDAFTDAVLRLDDIEVLIVRCFDASLDEIAARVRAQLGEEYDPDQVREAIATFTGSLAEMGMLAEVGLDGPTIKARQAGQLEEDRRREHRDALHAAVVHAVTKVPFHRERLAELKLSPERVATPESLWALPAMTKADIRANFPDRLVPDGADVRELLAKGDLSIGTTSGSTDERLQVLFDYRTGRLPDDYRRLWRVHDTVGLEKGAVFTSPVCAGFECHLGKLSMEERLRDSTLTLNSCDDPMSLRDDEVRAIVEELNEFRPDVLFTNPWYAVCLLRRCQALELSLPSIEVLLSSYQYLTLRHRKLMEEGFHTKVFSYYGATDLGGSLIATECAAGHMHVRNDHVHLELLESHDDSERFGDLGMVTVTTLDSKWMPLLRYQVGDLARPASACHCEGGTDWPCIQLEGRVKDLVFRRDGSPVTTREVDQVIGASDLDFYRLLQDDEVFTLEAIPAEGFHRERLRRRLERLLGPGIRLDIEEVRTLAPERSLKFRQTISRSPGPPRAW